MTPLSLQATLCPTGKLRAAINLGNPILANLDTTTGQPFGVSVDLAHELAKRLNIDLELVVVTGAAKSVSALNDQNADVGFFAIDPLRGAEIAFTAPYVLIEGCYLVPKDSAIRTNADVDQAGVRVAVGTGSAYDLFLTREIKNAQIVREPNVAGVVDAFLTQQLEVAAGIKQALEASAQQLPDLRLLDGHFMVIQQAMGVPKRFGHEAAAYLSAFVEEMKASGFVAEALARHHIKGASVASVV
ncbi:MAG: ABC transporter substrate-binding protein [Burkholderiaceae bacterium]|nr:ABC transporter substrate-binding protein [Burkholderiaceae bacterium]